MEHPTTIDTIHPSIGRFFSTYNHHHALRTRRKHCRGRICGLCSHMGGFGPSMTDLSTLQQSLGQTTAFGTTCRKGTARRETTYSFVALLQLQIAKKGSEPLMQPSACSDVLHSAGLCFISLALGDEGLTYDRPLSRILCIVEGRAHQSSNSQRHTSSSGLWTWISKDGTII